MNTTKTNKLKRIPSFIMAGLINLSAMGKLSGAAPLIEHYTELVLVQYLTLFGLMEVAFAGLLLYTPTLRIGFLLLTAYFGGAIAVELSHNGPFIVPLFLLTLVWVATYLRQPAIFRETTPDPAIHYV